MRPEHARNITSNPVDYFMIFLLTFMTILNQKEPPAAAEYVRGPGKSISIHEEHVQVIISGTVKVNNSTFPSPACFIKFTQIHFQQVGFNKSN